MIVYVCTRSHESQLALVPKNRAVVRACVCVCCPAGVRARMCVRACMVALRGLLRPRSRTASDRREYCAARPAPAERTPCRVSVQCARVPVSLSRDNIASTRYDTETG